MVAVPGIDAILEAGVTLRLVPLVGSAGRASVPFIENAYARPPHLVFVVRLGSSGEMLCFLQFLCCVIAACLSLALLVPLGFVTIV